MELSETYLATKAKISAHLGRLGWVTGLGTIALGTKTYQTAVGEKEAIVYLIPSMEGEQAYFRAEYTSEGNNVLSTLRAGWKPIGRLDSDEELAARALALANEIDAEVAQTYAMKLLTAKA